jgi:hypothetical protein
MSRPFAWREGDGRREGELSIVLPVPNGEVKHFRRSELTEKILASGGRKPIRIKLSRL